VSDPRSTRISRAGRVGNCLTFFVTALPDFRRKASGKKALGLVKRVSVVWVLDRSISDEERACLLPSARVVGCLSGMWIGNTRRA